MEWGDILSIPLDIFSGIKEGIQEDWNTEKQDREKIRKAKGLLNNTLAAVGFALDTINAPFHILNKAIDKAVLDKTPLKEAEPLINTGIDLLIPFGEIGKALGLTKDVAETTMTSQAAARALRYEPDLLKAVISTKPQHITDELIHPSIAQKLGFGDTAYAPKNIARTLNYTWNIMNNGIGGDKLLNEAKQISLMQMTLSPFEWLSRGVAAISLLGSRAFDEKVWEGLFKQIKNPASDKAFDVFTEGMDAKTKEALRKAYHLSGAKSTLEDTIAQAIQNSVGNVLDKSDLPLSFKDKIWNGIKWWNGALFNHWISPLKQTTFLKLMSDEIAKNPNLIDDPILLANKATYISKAVENSLGELPWVAQMATNSPLIQKISLEATQYAQSALISSQYLFRAFRTFVNSAEELSKLGQIGFENTGFLLKSYAIQGALASLIAHYLGTHYDIATGNTYLPKSQYELSSYLPQQREIYDLAKAYINANGDYIQTIRNFFGTKINPVAKTLYDWVRGTTGAQQELISPLDYGMDALHNFTSMATSTFHNPELDKAKVSTTQKAIIQALGLPVSSAPSAFTSLRQILPWVNKTIMTKDYKIDVGKTYDYILKANTTPQQAQQVISWMINNSEGNKDLLKLAHTFAFHYLLSHPDDMNYQPLLKYLTKQQYNVAASVYTYINEYKKNYGYIPPEAYRTAVILASIQHATPQQFQPIINFSEDTFTLGLTANLLTTKALSDLDKNGVKKGSEAHFNNIIAGLLYEKMRIKDLLNTKSTDAAQYNYVQYLIDLNIGWLMNKAGLTSINQQQNYLDYIMTTFVPQWLGGMNINK